MSQGSDPRSLRLLAGPIAALAMAVLSATPATAGPPTPQSCEIGKVVLLGGTTGGASDPRTETVILVRRFTNPVPYSNVQLYFQDCGGDVAVCATQPDPGVSVLTPSQVVYAWTDAEGKARFHLVGSSNGGSTGGLTTPCVSVYADGMPLGQLRVATFDLDGRDGVTPIDLSLFLADSFGAYRSRSDYNGDGALQPTDLSLLLRAVFSGGSTASCSAAAP